MKSLTAAAVALAASTLLAGCDRQEQTTTAPPVADTASSSQPATPSEVEHRAAGTVTAVTTDTVTIDHGPVETLGWPAMTMAFKASQPNQLADTKVGQSVAFAFRQDGSGAVLTSIAPQAR